MEEMWSIIHNAGCKTIVDSSIQNIHYIQCVSRSVLVLCIVAGQKMQTKRSQRQFRCMTLWWRRGPTGETTWIASSSENGQKQISFLFSSVAIV